MMEKNYVVSIQVKDGEFIRSYVCHSLERARERAKESCQGVVRITQETSKIEIIEEFEVRRGQNRN